MEQYMKAMESFSQMTPEEKRRFAHEVSEKVKQQESEPPSKEQVQQVAAYMGIK